MFGKIKKVISGLALASAVSTVAVADSILPADINQQFTDGTTDIKTVIGLIFGVLVVILVYRMVKKVF